MAIRGLLAELQAEADVQPIILTEDITLFPPTKAQMREIVENEGDQEAQDRILFGDTKYDAIVALFEDQPYQLWNKFVKHVREAFFGAGADDVEGKSRG